MRTIRMLATLLTCLYAGCADYRYTVNERVVYTPAPLFRDYNLPDPGLRNCVHQHIVDAGVTRAAQLTELNCSHAGIEDLSGIEVFAGLAQLGLSNNRLEELASLAEMDSLRELRLDGNRLRGLRALHGLVRLTLLDVRGNPDLPCTELGVFRSRGTVELLAPSRCD